MGNCVMVLCSNLLLGHNLSPGRKCIVLNSAVGILVPVRCQGLHHPGAGLTFLQSSACWVCVHVNELCTECSLLHAHAGWCPVVERVCVCCILGFQDAPVSPGVVARSGGHAAGNFAAAMCQGVLLFHVITSILHNGRYAAAAE